MARWQFLTLIGLVAGMAAVSLAAWLSSRARSRLVAQLVERRMPVSDGAIQALDELPAPVARYFRHVLRCGHSTVRMARIRQSGALRTGVHSERWLSFEARHVVVPPSVGFVWDARVHIAPLVHLRVSDALIGGQGSGRVSLVSTFTLMSERGAPEMTSGALHRYLAEAVWYPTALLPGPALAWSAIDDHRALATLTHGGVTVTLEFRFDDAGEVTGIYTPARWGRFEGDYKPMPWEGEFCRYGERDGLLVPSEGEAAWHVNGRKQTVWKGRVTSASYEFG